MQRLLRAALKLRAHIRSRFRYYAALGPFRRLARGGQSSQLLRTDGHQLAAPHERLHRKNGVAAAVVAARRAKQARINLQTASWEAEDNRRQLSNKVSELQSQLARQRERLAYYEQAAVKEAEALQNSALKKFQESETSISEFIQSLNAAREIKRGYIETVYAYNVTILELELYTE